MTHIEHVGERKTCKRGCVRARRHLPTCDGIEGHHDACRGCLPRDAEHGFLCYGCHKRLVDFLTNAGYQMELLALMSGHKGQGELTAETQARITTTWRTDSNQVLRTLYAKATTTAVTASEPYRIAVADAEEAIKDRLGMWVIHLVNDYAIRAPEADTVKAYATWLLRHIERLEHREAIGDELEDLSEIMSTAHGLAPWRESVTRLRGIPCPECHTTALVLIESESDVTCLRCKATMTHERYGIWTKILADEHKERAG